MRTVAIIDDDHSVRRALERLLKSEGYAVWSFASADSYLLTAGDLDADCLLLDVNMPGRDGLALQESLTHSGAHSPPIVFLTGFGDIPMSVKAMKHGAVDFLQKPVDDRTLLDAIAAATARSTELRAERAQLAVIGSMLSTLTPRESEVLKHIAAGKLNKQIASDLNISEKTVKVHRGRVMNKLELRSVAQLVRLVERAGIALE